MSDTPRGAGWWQASNDKWYPPEVHPDAGRQSPPVVPTGPIVPAKKPWWRRWWAIALGVLVLVGVVAAIATPTEEADAPSTDTAPPSAATGDADTNDADDSGGGGADDATAPTDPADAPDDEPATEPTEPEERDDAPEATDPPVTEPEQPAAGSRELPFAIGTPVPLTLDVLGDADGSTWTLTVDGPGADITKAVLDENPFNDPPDDGELFYGVPVTLTLNGAGKEPLSPLFNVSLEYFGPSTLEIVDLGFDESCGVTPNELDLLKEVFVGGSITGTVCYAVEAADAEAGIMLTVDEIEAGRIFVATVPGVGVAAPADRTAPGDPITTVPPAGDEGAGSRSAPHPLGTPVGITLDTFGDSDGSTWTVSVDGPGADITQAVLAENAFNDPPEEGKVFYGVPITLTLDGAGKEPLSPLFSISLEFFGPSTLEIIDVGFDESCGVTPNELDLLKEVFVGGSISGTVCYSVTVADADAGILLTLDEIEGDRIFLATR